MTSFLHGAQGLDLNSLSELEEIALGVMRELAHLGLEYYSKNALSILKKSDNSPVTEADLAIEDKARDLLDYQTPEFGFAGEERPAVKRLGDCVVDEAFQPVAAQVHNNEGVSQFERLLNLPVADHLNRDLDVYWLLDPIDGTLNFIEKVPLWSTLLALVYKGSPVLGMVCIPCLNEVFVASKGRGARHGNLQSPLQDFRPCFVREGYSLNDAIINSAPPNLFAMRGVDSWFSHLHSREGRIRVQGDAFGYTRILKGGVDAMLDPMVSDHDVAALQVLFQETPGAFFSSWHGNQGERTFMRGGVIAAASDKLGMEILRDYWTHLESRAPDIVEATQQKGFFEAHPSLDGIRWGVESEYRAWLFAMEKSVAEFKLQNPSVHIEDIAVVGEYSHSLRQRVKNGSSDDPAQADTAVGVQVRAVVAGGVGLASSALPLQVSKFQFVSKSIAMAYAHSVEQKCAPNMEILAARPKISGHFGNVAWGARPAYNIFRSIVSEIRSQHESVKNGEIRVAQSGLDQSVSHRFQFFLDGVRQTVSDAHTFLRSTSTAEREGEKRQGFMRSFFPSFLNQEEIVQQSKTGLEVSAREALELLDAQYVPENVNYDFIAIDADLLGLILHEALGHAMEGDFIQLGSSGLASNGALRDLAVAPDWLNIAIDGNLPNCGYSAVDYEGTPAIRKTIVRQGRLVEAIHTRESARALGHVPDGCARAETIFNPCMNRMTSIWVQANPLRPISITSKEEPRDFLRPNDLQKALAHAGVFEQGKTVLYLTGWKGGTATCSNLEFRADVRKVYLIRENQEPTLMRSANFTGIATACFQSALAAFGPVMCHTIGMCGKDGQQVPTSDGGPMVLLLGKHDQVKVIGVGDGE